MHLGLFWAMHIWDLKSLLQNKEIVIVETRTEACKIKCMFRAQGKLYQSGP
jgi:hypothetical protein